MASTPLPRFITRVLLTALIAVTTLPKCALSLRHHDAFVAWLAAPLAAQSNSNATGAQLAANRRAELGAAFSEGRFSEVIAASRSLASVLSPGALQKLPPAVSGEIADSYQSLTAQSVEVAICAPLHPVTKHSHAHIEREVVLSDGTTLPMVAFGAGASRFRTSYDDIPLQGAIITMNNASRIFLVDEAMVDCDPTPSSHHSANASSAAAAAAAEQAINSSSSSVSAAWHHKCTLGGVRASFSSPFRAQQAAEQLFELGSLSRAARFGLRSPSTVQARARRALHSDALASLTTTTPQVRNWAGALHSPSPGARGPRSLFIPASFSSGNRSALAVRVLFSDQLPSDAIAASDASTIMSTAAANFARMSYGAMWLNYTLPANTVNLSLATTSLPSASLIASATTAALAANFGLNSAAYSHFIILMPWCDWLSFGGLGDVQGTKVWLNFQDVDYSIGE